MNSACRNPPLWLWVCAFVLLRGGIAHADGGSVVATGGSEAFVVTVFAAPTPPVTGATELSVLVQNRESREVILDAAVHIELRERQSGRSPLAIDAAATRAGSANKLLYVASIDLPAPGDWSMRVLVARGGERAELTCHLEVGSGSSQAGVLWPHVLVVSCLVLLFALHQWLAGNEARLKRVA